MQLLFGDMRLINVPEKVDVLVSELLGSFGDNELSPECLDGAMRFLKREQPPYLCAPQKFSKLCSKWDFHSFFVYCPFGSFILL
jgi:hypothetical protein